MTFWTKADGELDARALSGPFPISKTPIRAAIIARVCLRGHSSINLPIFVLQTSESVGSSGGWRREETAKGFLETEGTMRLLQRWWNWLVGEKWKISCDRSSGLVANMGHFAERPLRVLAETPAGPAKFMAAEHWVCQLLLADPVALLSAQPWKSFRTTPYFWAFCTVGPYQLNAF